MENHSVPFSTTLFYTSPTRQPGPLYLLNFLCVLLARYTYQKLVSVAKHGLPQYFLSSRSVMAVRRRWRNDGSAGLAPFPFVGAGRGGGLGISAAYAQGTRAMFMERYKADLQRLMDREDLPADAKWFDSHCHLDPWRSHETNGINFSLKLWMPSHNGDEAISLLY